jgi:hypothetical protein
VFEAIYNFKPYQTPITQWYMANKRNKLATGNPKFEIQEDVLVPHLVTLSAAIAGGSATENLTAAVDYIYAKLNDLLLNPSNGEVYRITTAVTTSTLAVTRWPSGNITADTNAARVLINIGTAFAEKGTSAEALSTQGTFPINYTQILKKAVEMSGTQMATENYGGSDWANQRIKATEEFKLDIERMSVFGIQGIVTTSGAHVRASSGLLDTTSGGMGITDASQFVGGILDTTEFATEEYFFNTFCKNLYAKGSNEKVLYCGADALLGINNFSKVKLQTKVGEKEYGTDVQVILTPFGRMKLVWHPLLEQGYSNWAIGVDRDDYLKYRFLSANGTNRDMQYQENIHTPGTDERKDQYLAEIGMHLAGGSQGVHRVLKPGATA